MARFKYLYRQGENLLSRAEKTDSVISGRLGKTAADLTDAWRGVLFNSFHDILPGSSIERAFEDQTASMGEVISASQRTEFRALNRLARQIDTRVAPHPVHHPSGMACLVWNPHGQPYRGHVEMETCLDYRPVWKYDGKVAEIPLRVLGPQGKPLPFQDIALENRSMVNVPWRKRVLVPVTLPAFGWNVLELGWVEGSAPEVVRNPVKSGPNWIENGEYRVTAAVSRRGIKIHCDGEPVLSGEGLSAAVFDDPWGSWGGMVEEPDSTHFTKPREVWTIAESKVLETGPERALLWVRLAGAKSHMDLSISVSRDRSAVDISARVFWTERSARLKLRFPAGDEAVFEVPGATVKRKPCGEVPGGKWVTVGSHFGFASNALYNFDCRDGALSATVVRSTRYADDVPTVADSFPWLPATDLGELKFRFVITAQAGNIPQLARELEQPPVVMLVPASKGKLPRVGSLASLQPASLQLLALKRAEEGKGYILRVQGSKGKSVRAKLNWMDNVIELGTVKSGQILSWYLEKNKSGWTARAIDLTENSLEKKSEPTEEKIESA